MNRPATANRADALFAVYCDMGVNRTLNLLYERVRQMGVRVSLKTLERYSSQFGWQARIADVERKADERIAERKVERVEQMNERQAQAGRLAQSIAVKAFETIASRADFLEPRDALRFLKDGQHVERLAMGEATSRSEIEVRVYSELLVQVEALWVEVTAGLPEALPDFLERDRRFRVGVDSLVEAHASGIAPEVRATGGPDSSPEA